MSEEAGVLTLTSVLDRTLRTSGPQTAIADPEGAFTWTEFGNRVACAASLLQSLGVKQGDRYAIICCNSFRNAELMHAGYWMGAVPVPINFRLAPPEIAYILENADCGLTVVEHDFAGVLDANELAGRANNVLLVGAPADDRRPQYDLLLTNAEPAPLYDGAQEEDEALLVYTGGTTGRAKGVPLSHRNIVSNAMQIGLMTAPRPNDVFLHVAPMFHSADLLAIPYMLAGAAHLYLPKFTSAAVFQAIEEFGVTSSMLTPTMIIIMLQDPDFGSYDISTLRQVIYGSSPMAAEWFRKALERFDGVEFIQAYGLTETAPLLTMLSMAEHQQAVACGDEAILKSVGQPLVGVDLRLVDTKGEEMPPGGAGEVVVRGPNVAVCYLKRPEATAEAFRDGWFFTGDMGRLDERGRLYLLDRKKDMIITGGELVYSLEVEAALYQNSNVLECAVVGVPDEVYGEALLAAVVPAPGVVLTDDELIEHCRGRIGGYKIPRRYVFLEELPKSAVNKVLKNELRRIYGKQPQADDRS
jgi:long-chain acyl-CoA synthetase